MMKAGYPNFDFDATKYMAQLKLPVVDTDALVTAQRKNFEALTAASQRTLEGVGALIRRQSEIAREAMETYTKLVGDMVGEGTPEEKAARQADAAKQAYDRAVVNARELSEMAVKTRDDAFGVLNERIREGFGEMKDIVVNGAARATAATEQATANVKDAAGSMARATEQTTARFEQAIAKK